MGQPQHVRVAIHGGRQRQCTQPAFATRCWPKKITRLYTAAAELGLRLAAVQRCTYDPQPGHGAAELLLEFVRRGA